MYSELGPYFQNKSPTTNSHERKTRNMKIKALAGSAMAVGLLGLGMLAGSLVGSGGAFAQTPSTTPAQAAATPHRYRLPC